MKHPYIIEEFFPASGDERFSLSAESPLDQVTYNIFSAEDFTDAAIYDYGERICFFPETNEPLAAFYSRFSRWKAQRGADIAAAFSVLKKRYKPLENYDMIEKHLGTETGTQKPDGWEKISKRYPELERTETETPEHWKESSEESYIDYKEKSVYNPIDKKKIESESYTDYKETEEQKPENWKKKTEGSPAGNGSNEVQKVVPYDADEAIAISEINNTLKTEQTETQSGTYKTERGKEGIKEVKTTEQGREETELEKSGTIKRSTEQSGKLETTIKETGTDTTVEKQRGTFEDKKEYNTTLTRSGNIGVTTSQQMAESELKLREHQFVKDVIAEFFNLVSVYC